jgi:hypothetical protein
MRQRITDHFTQRYDEAKTLQAELDDIETAQPAQDDPALLDELPYAAAAFTTAPEHIKAKIYAAFDIQVLYRAPIKQATIWATITPTTPGIITALTTDPRTDNGTAYGHLPNAPIHHKRRTIMLDVRIPLATVPRPISVDPPGAGIVCPSGIVCRSGLRATRTAHDHAHVRSPPAI